MKVYLGKVCTYDGCEFFKTVVKVFDDEVKALIWKDERWESEYDWREYEEMELE